MKRSNNALFLFIFLLIFTSCSKLPEWTKVLDTGNVVENIQPPKLAFFALKGTWKVKDVLSMKEDSTAKISVGSTEECYISDELFRFESLVSTNPRYKSYRVRKEDFFINNYAGYAKNLAINSEYIDVFVAYDEDNNLYQNLIRIDEATICLPYQGQYYVLTRTDTNVPKNVIDKSKEMEIKNPESAVETSQALILGIRSLVSELNEEDAFTYRTYLVSFNGPNAPVHAYSLDNLYIPRKGGFQKLTNERVTTDFTIDRLLLDAIGDGAGQSTESSVLKALTYVGRDFLSTQNKNMLSINHELTLGIYRLDDIESYTPLDVEEYGGKPGYVQYEEMVSRARADANTEQINKNDIHLPNSYEIGISHSEGQWIFTGMVRAESQGVQTYKEYQVNLIPRIKLLPTKGGYTWRDIKGFDPSAVDCVSAPDKGYLAIQTPTKMEFYHTSDGNIDSKADFHFRLKETDKIVMEEWASGDEMNYWIDILIKSGAVKIEGGES